MNYIEKYVEKVKKTHELYVITRLAVTLASCGIVFFNKYKIISTKLAVLLAIIMFRPLFVFSIYYESLFRCPACGDSFKGIGVKKDMFGILPKHCPHCGTTIDKDKPDYDV